MFISFILIFRRYINLDKVNYVCRVKKNFSTLYKYRKTYYLKMRHKQKPFVEI